MKKSGIAVSKPIPISWYLWNGDLAELVGWVESLGSNPEKYFKQSLRGDVSIIDSNSETTELKAGNIVIKGISGEFFSTTPTDFDKSYNILE